MSKAGEQRLPDLPLLTAAERHQLLVEWNETQAEYPTDVCIHELFEAQVERAPDRLAVVFEDEHVTYGELNRRANQLAHRLRALRVGPDGLVGICVERSVEMVVGLLGILKAGGAYVPLDPSYPPERLAFMLEDAQVSVLLTQLQIADCTHSLRSGHGLQITTARQSTIYNLQSTIVICLDADWDSIAQQPATNPAIGVSAGNLAYAIYTSGSTGKPKGVLLTQRALCNHMLWMQTTFAWQRDERVLQKTPFGFDASMWEFYAPLLIGGQVILARPQGHLDSAYLVQTVLEQQVTVLQLVPTLLRALVAEPMLGACTSLAHVFCGGEALAAELAERLQARLPMARLHNLYGPTETTIDATYWTWRGMRDGLTVPIGRPVANMQCYVLDQDLQPAPRGVAGELYLGGVHLARGYWRRPDLTAEKFIPNPFDDQRPTTNDQRRQGDKETRGQGDDEASTQHSTLNTQHSRLYRTGDLARYLPDGALEFLGRIDQQVKVRGYRIELAEVEAALEQHPAVQHVVVMAREDQPGDKRLVAYVVPTNDQRPTTNDQRPGDKEARGQGDKGREQSAIYNLQSVIPEKLSSILYPLSSDLRAFLKQHLPEYMVPATFVVLEALPLTPNGKVDRRALPAPAARELETAFVPAYTTTQQMLVGIWEHVLGTRRVGIHDNFFELGGHSVLAAQIVARLQQLPGQTCTTRTLFEAPTIASLAERIEAIAHTQPEQPSLPIGRVSRAAPLPLSYEQQQLWLLDQLEPGNVAYNICFPLRLSGSLNIVTLQRSLEEIVRRHEILRTTFAKHDRQLAQIIGATPRLALPLVDLREWPAAECQAEALRLARADARRPFDLRHGPLLRVTVLQLGDSEHVLLLTLHHIVVDGWSIGVLLNELGALYTAFSTGRPSPLPELPIQYADYAAWQRTALHGKELARQLAYWKDRLAGAPTLLELPTDRPRPRVQTFRGARVPMTMPAALSARLKHLSQQAGVTLFMTLLAAFKVLLYYHSGQTDIVVGSPIANRTRPEVEGLIGYFVNTLVLRTRLEGMAGELTFGELLGRVRETALQAYVHAEVPFEKLIVALQPEREQSYNPLFQVMFIVQNAPMAMPALPELNVTPMTVDMGIAQFDLSLEIEETGQELKAAIEYNTDLFDATTIRQMLVYYQTLLESIAADSNQTLSALLPSIKMKPRQIASGASESQPNAPSNKDRIAARKAKLSDQRAQLSAEEQALLERRMRRK